MNSYDYWDRRRIEGYGWVNIPSFNGNHQISIPTWKAQGTIVSKLREYFIGGSPELYDLTYPGIPFSWTSADNIYNLPPLSNNNNNSNPPNNADDKQVMNIR